MATIVVEISGDEKKFIDAMRKLEQAAAGGETAMGKLAKKASEVTDETKKQERANADLEKAAKRVWEETRTPQEHYAAKMAELNTLVNAGKLKQEDYGKAVKNASDELKRAQNAGHAAFGSQALGDLKSFAAGVVGIGSAVSLTIKLFEEMKRIKAEAAAEGRAAEASGAQLKQLTMDPATGLVDPKRYAEIHATANRVRAAGGFPSLEEARQFTFKLYSAGMEKDAGFYAAVKREGVVSDVEGMAGGVEKIRSSMGAAAGPARDVFNAMLGGSSLAPTYAQELAPAVAAAGPGARQLGIKLPELISATATLSKPLKSGDQAGTYLAQIERSLLRIGSTGGVGELSEEELLAGGSEEANLREVWAALNEKRGKKLETPSEKLARTTAETHLRGALERGKLSPEARNALQEREKTKLWKKQISQQDYERATETVTAEEFDKRLLALQPEVEEKPKGPLFDFKGKSLIEMVRMVDAAGLNPAQLQKLYGRAQAAQAHHLLLLNQDDVVKGQQAVANAQEFDAIGGMMKLQNIAPDVDAAGALRVQKAAREQASLEMGTASNMYEAVMEHQEAEVARGNTFTPLGRPLHMAAGRITRGIVGLFPAWKSQEMSYALKSGQLDDDPALKGQVQGYFENLNQAAESLKQAAQELRASQRPNPTLAQPDQDR